MPAFDDKRLMPPAGKTATVMQVKAGAAAIRSAPRDDAEMVTQALHGETLHLFQQDGAYGYVQLERDRYVGWTLLDALAAPVLAPTHRLSALRTYAYSKPDLKSAPQFILSQGSLLTVSGKDGRFFKLERGGWVPGQHVAALDHLEGDPAGNAERFRHAPYLWGGCESLGLDCTGLTRAAFGACGVQLPRDSDMQFDWCGEPVENWASPGTLTRNDLVFWKGHVGIMLDSQIFLHANAHHMAVASEPLSGAIERIAKIYGEPIGARRIDIAFERNRTPDWLS